MKITKEQYNKIGNYVMERAIQDDGKKYKPAFSFDFEESEYIATITITSDEISKLLGLGERESIDIFEEAMENLLQISICYTRKFNNRGNDHRTISNNILAGVSTITHQNGTISKYINYRIGCEEHIWAYGDDYFLEDDIDD